MIICPACKSENEDHYKFCLTCGVELASAPKKQDSSPRIGGGRANLGDLKSKLQALRAGRGAFVESSEKPTRLTQPGETKLPGWTEPPSIAPVVEETPRLTGDIAAPEFEDEPAGASEENQEPVAEEARSGQPEPSSESDQTLDPGDNSSEAEDSAPSDDGELTNVTEATDQPSVADDTVTEPASTDASETDDESEVPAQPSVTITSSSPQP